MNGAPSRPGRALTSPSGTSLPGLRAFHATLRFCRAAAVLLPIYIGYLLLWISHQYFHFRFSEPFLDRLHTRNAKKFLRLALALRGGMIKVGQFISTRADVMPRPWIEQLAELQDRVEPTEWVTIHRHLSQEYGRPPEQIFAKICPEAVAAASFGQVHRAETHDGRDVALKIRYPDVAQKLDVDLLVLRIAVPLFNIFIPKIRLGSMYGELRTILTTELDYLAEARYATTIRQNLSGVPGIFVPAVLPEYSTASVIATEYFEGYRILDREHMSELGVNPAQLLELVLAAWAKMMYEDGVFQSDPHPGNLLFRAREGRPELCILDFGQVKVLPPGFQKALFGIATAVMSRNVAGVAGGLVDLGMLNAADAQTISPFIERFFAKYMHLTPAEARALDFNHIRKEVSELLGRIDGLTVPSDVIMHGRTLSLLAGIASHLDESANLLVLARPHLTRLLFSLAKQAALQPAKVSASPELG